MFNLTSYTASDLVESASLLLSLPGLPGQTGVRVSQLVPGGEISLDRLTTSQEEEQEISLDVSHGVAGWLTEPHSSSLALSVSLDNNMSCHLTSAQLVLQTRHARQLVRQKRETADKQQRGNKCRGKCCRSAFVRFHNNINDLGQLQNREKNKNIIFNFN